MTLDPVESMIDPRIRDTRNRRMRSYRGGQPGGQVKVCRVFAAYGWATSPALPGRIILEALVGGQFSQPIEPRCTRSQDDLGSWLVAWRIEQRRRMNMDFVGPFRRPKVESGSAGGTEPPERARATFEMHYVALPANGCGRKSEKGGKGRGRGPLAIGAVADKIARSRAERGPCHPPTKTMSIHGNHLAHPS